MCGSGCHWGGRRGRGDPPLPRSSILLAILAFPIALTVGAGAAQEASPGPSPSPAATPTPAIIADYVAAPNAHDPERVAALYADAAVVEQAVRGGDVFRGRAEIAGWVAANLGGGPDLTVTTTSVILDGDRIA